MSSTNPFRISARQLASEIGVDLMELLEESTFEGIAPACCTEGCEVEPDGHCEHGCPSVMLAVGLI
jgi:hypothetical protein